MQVSGQQVERSSSAREDASSTLGRVAVQPPRKTLAKAARKRDAFELLIEKRSRGGGQVAGGFSEFKNNKDSPNSPTRVLASRINAELDAELEEYTVAKEQAARASANTKSTSGRGGAAGDKPFAASGGGRGTRKERLADCAVVEEPATERKKRPPLRRYLNDTPLRRLVFEDFRERNRFIFGDFPEADRLINLGEDYDSDLDSDALSSVSSDSSLDEQDVAGGQGEQENNRFLLDELEENQGQEAGEGQQGVVSTLENRKKLASERFAEKLVDILESSSTQATSSSRGLTKILNKNKMKLHQGKNKDSNVEKFLKNRILEHIAHGKNEKGFLFYDPDVDRIVGRSTTQLEEPVRISEDVEEYGDVGDLVRGAAGASGVGESAAIASLITLMKNNQEHRPSGNANRGGNNITGRRGGNSATTTSTSRGKVSNEQLQHLQGRIEDPRPSTLAHGNRGQGGSYNIMQRTLSADRDEDNFLGYEEISPSTRKPRQSSSSEGNKKQRPSRGLKQNSYESLGQSDEVEILEAQQIAQVVGQQGKAKAPLLTKTIMDQDQHRKMPGLFSLVRGDADLQHMQQEEDARRVVGGPRGGGEKKGKGGGTMKKPSGRRRSSSGRRIQGSRADGRSGIPSQISDATIAEMVDDPALLQELQERELALNALAAAQAGDDGPQRTRKSTTTTGNKVSRNYGAGAAALRSYNPSSRDVLQSSAPNKASHQQLALPSSPALRPTTGELFENVLTRSSTSATNRAYRELQTEDFYDDRLRDVARIVNEQKQAQRQLERVEARVGKSLNRKMLTMEKEKDKRYQAEMDNQRRAFLTMVNRMARQHRDDLSDLKKAGEAKLKKQIVDDDKRYHALMKKDQLKFDELLKHEEEHARKALEIHKADMNTQKERTDVFLELQKLRQTDFADPIREQNEEFKRFEEEKQEEYLKALRELRNEDNVELDQQREAWNMRMVSLVQEFQAANEKRQAEMEDRMFELMNGQMTNLVDALASLKPPDKTLSRRAGWGSPTKLTSPTKGEDKPTGGRPWGQAGKWTVLGEDPQYDDEKYWTQTIIPVPKEMQADIYSGSEAATSDCLVSVDGMSLPDSEREDRNDRSGRSHQFPAGFAGEGWRTWTEQEDQDDDSREQQVVVTRKRRMSEAPPTQPNASMIRSGRTTAPFGLASRMGGQDSPPVPGFS
ncbi:unnamed protein product [Amoebophrya sp. A25]|nr:unnamed protein product [Amoebophrya sp. A25]|eukprot:GSA25T00020665001.1